MEEFFGAIKLVAFNYDPEGFMACDGRILNVSQYQALFALLGCSFGGDGRTTFALPKLESPAKGQLFRIKWGPLAGLLVCSLLSVLSVWYQGARGDS
jgi:microcystin-dependent protein